MPVDPVIPSILDRTCEPPISNRRAWCPWGRVHRSSSGAARAMTLVEMSMVVVIIGTMSAVVIMRLGGQSFGQPGLRATARLLALDLRHARVLAITEGTNHYVGFNSDGWSVFRRDSPSDVPREASRTLPSNMGGSISAWDFEFDPTGAALAAFTCDLSSSGATYRIRVIMVTGATTVQKL